MGPQSELHVSGVPDAEAVEIRDGRGKAHVGRRDLGMPKREKRALGLENGRMGARCHLCFGVVQFEYLNIILRETYKPYQTQLYEIK